MKKFFAFLLAAVFAAGIVVPAQAEIKLPEDIIQPVTTGINGVYSLDFDTAHDSIEYVFSLYPNHPFGHFGNAMIAWARYEYEFETSDDKQRKVFEKTLDDSISGIKIWLKDNPQDPNAFMGIGALYGLRAMFAMRNRNWITSYFSGRKAIKNLEKALELDPTYYDAFFGLGIYQYYAGTLPSVIKVLAKIVAIKGNPDKGVAYLNLAREKATFTDNSAKLILIDVQNNRRNINYYAPEKSLQYIREIRAKFPKNPLMHYVEIICLFETGHYQEVLAGGKEFLSLIGSDKFYKDIYISRAYTAIGTSYMALGQWQDAKTAFEEGQKAIASQDPSRWGVWNEYRLAQVYDALGLREDAKKQYKKVLSYKDKWGFDEIAREGLKNPWKPATGKGTGPLPPSV
ncbi:tetratricopeptide repeat protein [Candidatus Avelusimicrobium sp.]